MIATETQAMPWTIERTGPVSCNIRIPYTMSADWEQYGLITADRHLDSPQSDHELQRYHLEQAKERGAFVLDFGDFFDAMQGKNDRRSAKVDLRPELAGAADDGVSNSYLNRLVEYAADFLEPYIDNIAVIAEGNHESSVSNKLEYNLIDGLIRDLHRAGGEHIIRGGYRGWVRFSFAHEAGGAGTSRLAYWTHGYGGGGPVTKDIIQVNRKAVYLSNADYVFSGHTHDQWWFPIERIKLLGSGREVITTQHHVKIPSYKDEFTNIGSGWHHETGKPPKPTGAWWIRFYYSSRTGTIETEFRAAER